MLSDFDAEGVTLFRVLHARIAAGANETGRTRRNGEASLVEREHRDLEALTRFAHQVFLGDFNVVHLEPAGVAGEDAPLLLHRPRRKTFEAALNHEGAETGGVARFLLLEIGPRD